MSKKSAAARRRKARREKETDHERKFCPKCNTIYFESICPECFPSEEDDEERDDEN